MRGAVIKKGNVVLDQYVITVKWSKREIGRVAGV